MDPALVLLVGACAFATSALTAVLGFGGGVVLLAVLVAFVDPLAAIPLHAAIQVVSNGTRTVVRRRDVDWSIVWRTSLLLLPAGLLTLSLARQASDAALQVAIAVAVLAATWLPLWLSPAAAGTEPGRLDRARWRAGRAQSGGGRHGPARRAVLPCRHP